MRYSSMEGSKDEEDFHREMRRRIQEVRSNAALTAAEKGREIQRLMTSRFTESTATETAPTVSNTTPSVTFADEANTIHGCKHYRTRCSIKSNCCAKWFTCRRCHDELINDHKINRYATEEMYCFLCGTIQPVAKNCRHCEKEMAKYYCDICKLWSDGDNAHQIFHCAKCGLCRVGEGQYEHCDQCHMCLAAGKPHKHSERAFESNCPICGEFLFTSTRAAITPDPCHHPIHHHCFRKLIKNLHFACPICHKTYADIDMAPQWDYVRNLIRATPLPEEYRGWKVETLCNDCVLKSVVPFHFFGAECPKCKVYNTSTTATYRQDGREVAEAEVQNAAALGENNNAEAASDLGSLHNDNELENGNNNNEEDEDLESESMDIAMSNESVQLRHLLDALMGANRPEIINNEDEEEEEEEDEEEEDDDERPD